MQKKKKRYQSRTVNPSKKLKAKRKQARRAEQVCDANDRLAYHHLRLGYLGEKESVLCP